MIQPPEAVVLVLGERGGFRHAQLKNEIGWQQNGTDTQAFLGTDAPRRGRGAPATRGPQPSGSRKEARSARQVLIGADSTPNRGRGAPATRRPQPLEARKEARSAR